MLVAEARALHILGKKLHHWAVSFALLDTASNQENLISNEHEDILGSHPFPNASLIFLSMYHYLPGAPGLPKETDWETRTLLGAIDLFYFPALLYDLEWQCGPVMAAVGRSRILWEESLPRPFGMRLSKAYWEWPRTVESNPCWAKKQNQSSSPVFTEVLASKCPSDSFGLFTLGK